MTDSRHVSARDVLLALLSLGILGLGGAAHASPRMYTGSLIIEAFGDVNSNSTSTIYQTAVGTGIPLTGNCNTLPYHAKEIIQIGTLTSQVITLTIPRYGGQVPSVDINLDTVSDIVAGCGKQTIAGGNPLYFVVWLALPSDAIVVVLDLPPSIGWEYPHHLQGLIAGVLDAMHMIARDIHDVASLDCALLAADQQGPATVRDEVCLGWRVMMRLEAAAGG
jgi:hypothetical protein